MELVLNLVWALLALAGIICWFRLHRSTQSSARCQLIALGMLALILFPVISVTDDLWALHNPAEIDTSLRRNDLTAHTHTIVPEIASLPVETATGAIPAFLAVARGAESKASPRQAVPLFRLHSRPPPTL